MGPNGSKSKLTSHNLLVLRECGKKRTQAFCLKETRRHGFSRAHSNSEGPSNSFQLPSTSQTKLASESARSNSTNSTHRFDASLRIEATKRRSDEATKRRSDEATKRRMARPRRRSCCPCPAGPAASPRQANRTQEA